MFRINFQWSSSKYSSKVWSDNIRPKQNRTPNEAASSDSDDIGPKQNRTSDEAASIVLSSDSDDIVTNSDEVTHIEQNNQRNMRKWGSETK